jgi:hypothetical protein
VCGISELSPVPMCSYDHKNTSVSKVLYLGLCALKWYLKLINNSWVN